MAGGGEGPRRARRRAGALVALVAVLAVLAVARAGALRVRGGRDDCLDTL